MLDGMEKLLQGYQYFREKYALGDNHIMQQLSDQGQQPETMIVACCDSRVDPALILQCGPGELFVVRNVANIVPPYEKDDFHHGTSAALEFGVRFLKIKQLIILGHSQCGGIQALLKKNNSDNNDFIKNWVSLITENTSQHLCEDEYAKIALKKSYHNCLTFPWIKEKLQQNELAIYLWYFDIKTGKIFTTANDKDDFQPL